MITREERCFSKTSQEAPAGEFQSLLPKKDLQSNKYEKNPKNI
jgi:hypothetical protein